MDFAGRRGGGGVLGAAGIGKNADGSKKETASCDQAQSQPFWSTRGSQHRRWTKES